MTPVSSDWAALSATWRTANGENRPVLADLRRREAVHRTRMRWLVVLELLATAVCFAILAWWLDQRRDAFALIVTGDALVFAAVIWVFTVWNRRGTWRPVDESVDAHLAVAILRCRRRRRTAIFVLVLVIAQAAAVEQLGRKPIIGAPPREPVTAALPVLVLVTYTVWSLWYRRKVGRDQQWLEALRAPDGETPL